MRGLTAGGREAGAGLVEIAVALLILSLGALGLARGQLAARQAAGEALQRNEAVRLAGGLAELVQGDPGDPAVYRFANLAELVAPPVDCTGQRCARAEWAAWALWQWRGELEGHAARDPGANAVAGLLAPAACLAPENGTAALELSWRLTPAGETVPCGAAVAPEGSRVLRLPAPYRMNEP